MKTEELKQLCEKAIDTYPDKVNNYKLGKVGLMGLFMGEVMKLSKGLADPKETNTMLKEMLEK